MIVVDSSAVIAIFRQEDAAEDYARNIAADDDPVMSAANLVETSIVLRGLKKINYVNKLACDDCSIRSRCTAGTFRTVSRLENEAVVNADQNP